MVEPANQELTSTATPEPIYNNTDVIEIDESTTTITGSIFKINSTFSDQQAARQRIDYSSPYLPGCVVKADYRIAHVALSRTVMILLLHM